MIFFSKLGGFITDILKKICIKHENKMWEKNFDAKIYINFHSKIIIIKSEIYTTPKIYQVKLGHSEKKSTVRILYINFCPTLVL